MDLLADVPAIDDHGLPRGHPERDVERRAILRHVHVLAAEHGLDALAQPALVCELQEQTHRVVGDPVLRVIQVQSSSVQREAIRAPGIGGEQLAQVQATDLGAMPLERSPGWPLA